MSTETCQSRRNEKSTDRFFFGPDYYFFTKFDFEMVMFVKITKIDQKPSKSIKISDFPEFPHFKIEFRKKIIVGTKKNRSVDFLFRRD